MTDIYHVSDTDLVAQYWSNKADAISFAKKQAKLSSFDIYVTRCTMAPMGKKEMLLAALNGNGWASKHEEVFIAKKPT